MVYVDDMQARYGRLIMCHMIADSHDELMAMAERIGVQLKWLQKEGTYKEHFDICLAKKRLAIRAGAKQVTQKQLIQIMLHKPFASLQSIANRRELETTGRSGCGQREQDAYGRS